MKIWCFKSILLFWVVPRFSESAFVTRFSMPLGLQSSLQVTSDVVDAAPDFNGVFVAKEGGVGAATASQQALRQNLRLGAPPARPNSGHFQTKGGVEVTAHVEALSFSRSLTERTSALAIEEMIDKLDDHRGVLFTSSYEFPGRYARWSLGFVDPPIEISGRSSECTIRALNERGRILIPAILQAMKQLKDDNILESLTTHVEENFASNIQFDDLPTRIDVKIVPPSEVGSFDEEDRSRQPSLFSVVRALVDLFSHTGDHQLGLYGAFGYDLTFQFEPIELVQHRDPEQRDLLLYLPDKMLVVDQDKRDAWEVSFEFSVDSRSTIGVNRFGRAEQFQPFQEGQLFLPRDTPPTEFAKSVERAKREFAVGNLFEAVLSQTFREKLSHEVKPSLLFRRLRARNPAPYGFFINLGEQEYLVGASPEMFVRCETIEDNEYRPGAMRVETCPISGTVARGVDALEDAQRVKSLMMNAKEESELTMCTDVDRNDKSRICEPGSVKVIGRRQIEMYSRLIHTVDHVEGYLRPEFDALDAFLCHTWAVTVTGAPKTWAIQFVEENERSQRCWYGGAVGIVGFDGSLNTGLTLRTVRVKNGIAEVRAGATLLYDSNPPAEELETELKASAMIDAIVQKGPEDPGSFTLASLEEISKVGHGLSAILIDHEDSFVHTLGNYLRQTGAAVQTLRSGPSALKAMEKLINDGKKPDIVVLSPGPGNPSDFGLSTTIEFLIQHKIPGFGVCLGLQGMVEHFGGTLGVLSYPMHGKPSLVTLTEAGKSTKGIFKGLPDSFEVARYHSLHGIRDRIPPCLDVTALTNDGIVMGIQHKTLPFAAVQFHPESILTSPAHGLAILKNALSSLKYADDLSSTSGAEIVGELEKRSVDELKTMLESLGMSTTGTKSEFVVRLALWKHKRAEAKAGNIQFESMSTEELSELRQGLGIKGVSISKDELIKLIRYSLLQSDEL